MRKASQWAQERCPPGSPPPESVELGDQREEAVLGGMDVGRECSDLVAEILESVQFVIGCPSG